LIRPWHEDHDSRLPSALGGFAYVRYSQTDSHYARYGTAYDLPTVESRGLVVPLWAVLGPTLPLPVLWAALWVARRLRGRRLATRGVCPSCRYDLRVTPGRCPECGSDERM
jgi:hypothetical protein